MNEKDVSLQKNFIRGREPKILCLDLEISPMLAYTYEAYEGNVLKIKVQPQIIAFAYSINDGEIVSRVLPDYAGYKSGILKMNDRKIVEDLYEIMKGMDMFLGHNFAAFDLKHARARFLYHQLPVFSGFRVEDTLKMARKYFRFPKNNLAEIAELLGVGTKSKVKHSDVIWDCIDGDKKSWEAMREYVKQDIVITQGVYKRLAPWHETHYNLNLIKRVGNSCPVCLGTRVRKEGVRFNRYHAKQRYSCYNCKHWWTGEIVAKAPKLELVSKEIERVNQSNI